MKTIMAAFVVGLISTTALAGHDNHVKDPDGQWLATFTLDAGPAGCPVHVAIPATFDGSRVVGKNAMSEKIVGMLDSHGKLAGFITTMEGFPGYQVQFDGTKFVGSWEDI